MELKAIPEKERIKQRIEKFGKWDFGKKWQMQNNENLKKIKEYRIVT